MVKFSVILPVLCVANYTEVSSELQKTAADKRYHHA